MARAESYAYFASTNDAFALPPGTLLWDINVGTGTSTSVLTVYDGPDNTGKVIALINGATVATYNFNGIRCGRGLYMIMTTAAAKITVTYS